MEKVEKRDFSVQKIPSGNHKATRARKGCFGLFALTLSLVCLCLASSVHAGWKLQKPWLQGNTLQGVWGSPGKDVFAVGWCGAILHHGGTNWSQMTSEASLFGVWGSSGTDVFAVGDFGIVKHYR